MGAGVDVEFFVDPADVGLDGRMGDFEMLGDFLEEKALREEFKDFPLARRKFVTMMFKGWIKRKQAIMAKQAL